MSFQRIPGLVSIVITVYNKLPYLSECLTSLLDQTYESWELILIDDASTDGSYEYVMNWLNNNEPLLREGKGIYTLRLPRNTGYAGAITTGMYLAKGEYIAIQDADDLSHPARLAIQVRYLNHHPHIDLIGTNYEVFEDGLPNRRMPVYWLKYGEQIGKVYEKGGHCICHGTVMFRGAVFDRIGGHTRRIEGAEDYEFIAKVIKPGARNVENLREVLYYYRKHPKQRSRNYFGKPQKEKNDDA
ncbi:glycosyltransferase involved in cell wall biosynthesis [Paenibacillus cellulosilyticus]|uniref:Glycosyltransferase involved in cell wall biosynthesis n=1 Tax=Paenibacillus cellulosilyticus TaxID=375489 RepID=A0A2V2YTT9_9BACL|nr:glycosyltransferase family 2 protein [Paenibacillus cellulosilyticus]PWW02835.1 glycosyltransferase involved in cell wall biosynthesis [Paenibacillus cellulosilyticus]QKS45753.1 glycosyltransferase family 2 protein [Paenibacillus cellulosilyticus]